MRSIPLLYGVGLTASLLAGCANVPSPNYVGVKDDEGGVTVDNLVSHIQCELYTAKGFDKLADQKYRASVTLTLKVEDIGGLSPSLSFIHAFVPTPESLTAGVGGTLSADRQRQFIDQYTIALDQLSIKLKKNPGSCADQEKTTLNLTGDLGIGGIIAAGLDTTNYDDVNVTAPSDSTGGSAGGPGSSYNVVVDPRKPVGTPPNSTVIVPVVKAPNTSKVIVPPAFGSTIQFTIVKSVNAGPTWSFSRFKGPSGSSGLVSYGRTDTDILVLAFAPAKPPSLNKGLLSDAAFGALTEQVNDAAEARAQSQMQSLTTTMILQNLGSLQTTPP